MQENHENGKISVVAVSPSNPGFLYSTKNEFNIYFHLKYYYRGSPDETVSISTVLGLTQIFSKGNSTDSSI